MEKDEGVEGSSSLHVLVYLAGMKSKCIWQWGANWSKVETVITTFQLGLASV